MQEFGAVHSAHASKGHKIGLRRTPAIQRRRPLLRAAQIEDLAAGIEHAAIDAAGIQSRALPGHHRDHRLIQECESFRDPALAEQRTPSSLQSESDQIVLSVLLADRCRLLENGLRLFQLTSIKGLVAHGQKQVAPLTAIRMCLQQARCSRQPPARLGRFPIQQEHEPEPEGTPRRLAFRTEFDESAVRSRQQFHSLCLSPR